ncbi:zinc finger matrin-type protein 1-like isoform X2 [Hyperolius riggenbachi]|uniref:zinc finger matrin-type protein 1-like isoform X2 n=1 Tax=Hyperolius riggenbachi TaxID=752182 RepID=UPI0035A2FC98
MASEGAIIPQLVESITQHSSPAAATCSGPMAGGDFSSSAQTEVFLDEKTKRELFTDSFCRVCGAVLQFESHRNAHYEGKKHAQKVRLYFLNKELEEMAYKQKADRVNFHADQEVANDRNKFCSLCNMVFSSPVVAQSHYVGKIHCKKLKQFSGEQSEWTAEASDPSQTTQDEKAVTPDTEAGAAASHVPEKSGQQEGSKEHPSSTAAQEDINEIDLTDPNKYCKLCCASFNNPLVATQHYNGKKHARNEMRRKMMEDMEDTGVPMESGEGIYVCPICSITLTSIEMYQAHMQGNKHQLKEHMVASVIRTTKKSYDSFENELQDYIKVQKARGLEPKTQFRQDKDQYDSAEDIEPAPVVTHPKPKPPEPYKFFGPLPKAYAAAYNPPHTIDPRMGDWEQVYWHNKPVVRKFPKTGLYRKTSPSSSDSSDYSSSDDSGNSFKKEKRRKREHHSKDRKHHKSKRENGSSNRKKRKHEKSDSEKEDCEKDKKADIAPEDKPKLKNDKKKKEEQSTDKESKKHKKTKKVEDQRTEEEILWDESILGF